MIRLSVAVFAVALLATYVFWPRHDVPRSTVALNTGLADRINAACGPGWRLQDWTLGDEFHPMPKGIIEVTCVRTNGSFLTKTVAIPR